MNEVEKKENLKRLLKTLKFNLKQFEDSDSISKLQDKLDNLNKNDEEYDFFIQIINCIEFNQCVLENILEYIIHESEKNG